MYPLACSIASSTYKVSMMTDDDKISSNINLDVGLGAKLELKGTIPEQSVGRALDALTDVIRLFSERAGLKADQVRLQRMDVAAQIARKAVEIRSIEGPIHPVPNKLLVPILEYGSCEAADDQVMIDRWAQLLATAASGKEVPPRFAQILRELNATQAKCLSYVGRRRTVRTVYDMIALNDAIAPLLDANNFDHAFSEAQKVIDSLGSTFADATATIQSSGLGEYRNPGETHSVNGDYLQAAYVLKSLGLIEIYATTPHVPHGNATCAWTMRYSEITPFGLSFLEHVEPRTK
jgi:hypothetical protein